MNDSLTVADVKRAAELVSALPEGIVLRDVGVMVNNRNQLDVYIDFTAEELTEELTILVCDGWPDSPECVFHADFSVEFQQHGPCLCDGTLIVDRPDMS